MDAQAMLAALKTNMTIAQGVTAYDTRLSQLLIQAESEIVNMGAVDFSTSGNIGDAELCISYAQHLWNSRDKNTGPSEGLRFRLHNRVLGSRMGGDGA